MKQEASRKSVPQCEVYRGNPSSIIGMDTMMQSRAGRVVLSDQTPCYRIESWASFIIGLDTMLQSQAGRVPFVAGSIMLRACRTSISPRCASGTSPTQAARAASCVADAVVVVLCWTLVHSSLLRNLIVP